MFFRYTNEEGELDRDDGPAVKTAYYEAYYKKGKLHRPWQDGPAFIKNTGEVQYHFEGKLHRPWQDGPAIIYADGSYRYIVNGKLHRPWKLGPAVFDFDEKEEFWENGQLHRPWQLGPATATIYGDYQYRENGNIHRPIIDGPAIIENGLKYYWFEGKKLDNDKVERFLQAREKRIRKLVFEVVRHWLLWLDDPTTKRGKRHMEKQYQKFLEINSSR